MNGSDFLFVIVVYFKFLLDVDEKHILGGNDNENRLILIKHTKEWLILKFIGHHVKNLTLLCLVVILKQVLHGEEKQLSALLKFEAELDASLLLRVLLNRLEVSHDVFLELLVSVLLINCKVSNFLLIFDELAAQDNTDLFLVIGDLHVQYLDFGFLCLLRDRPLLLRLERYLIVYT